MAIHIQMIVDAIESYHDSITNAYLDYETQRVFMQDEINAKDIANEKRYIPLPSKNEVNDYQIMADFIETVENDNAYDWLSHAIEGKGAFRKFRAAAERFGLLEDWYDYQAAVHEDIAVQWCEDHGIVYDFNEVEVVYEEEEDQLDEDAFLHSDFSEKPVTETVSTKTRFSIVSITARNIDRLLYLLEAAHPNQDFMEYVQNNLNHIHVDAAAINGRFVGYVLYDQMIKEIFVIKDQRKNGIGKALLMNTVHQYPDMPIRISPENSAGIGFLTHCGYQKPTWYLMHERG